MYSEQIVRLRSEVNLEAISASRSRSVLIRYQEYVDRLKSDHRAKRKRARDAQECVVAEEASACTTQSSKRRRTSLQPRKSSARRCKEYIETFPEHWSTEETQWVLAQIAATREVPPEALAESVRNLTVHKGKWNRQTTSQHQKDALRFQELYKSTETDAFTVLLSSLEEDVLVKLIPTTARRAIIRQWVSKVQEFWSKDRCALLKSATTTSNEAWQWFRTLLGRSVVDGELQDHKIDGM